MSIRKDLDELIDWYEAHDATAGQRIAVAATRNTARKFARTQRKRGGPLLYRGREVVPVRRPRGDRERQQQHEIMKPDESTSRKGDVEPGESRSGVD